MCNLKLAAAIQITNGVGAINVGVQSNTHKNKQEHNFHPTTMRKYIKLLLLLDTQVQHK